MSAENRIFSGGGKIIPGLVQIVAGLLFLFKPSLGTRAACLVLGGFIIISGLGSLSESRRAGGSCYGGGIILLLGLFIAFAGEAFVSFIPFAFGAYLLISGFSSVRLRSGMKKAGYRKSGRVAFEGVVKLALALTILINPFSTAMTLLRFMGLCAVYDGASKLFDFFRQKRAERQIRSYNLGRKNSREDIPVVTAEVVEDDR